MCVPYVERHMTGAEFILPIVLLILGFIAWVEKGDNDG
jgi:hypothetical protein